MDFIVGIKIKRKMKDEDIKKIIINEGFDTNLEADWYIWITCYKLGKYGKTKKPNWVERNILGLK